MKIIDKRNPLPGILLIVRTIAVVITLVAMVLFTVLAMSELDKKFDVLETLNDDSKGVPTLSLIPGYKKSPKYTYVSTDMGSFLSQVNFDYALQVDSKLNEIAIFTEAYHKSISNLPSDTPNLNLHKFLSRIDEQQVFDMWLSGFGKNSVQDELFEIRGYDAQFYRYYGMYLISLVAFLLCYMLIRPKNMFLGQLPKGEKSSVGRMPVYLTNILCYLTFGLFGVVLFLFEKRSRYAKQAAVQSMLVGILSILVIIMTTMMHSIFSYMFPPVQNITYILKFSGILFVVMMMVTGFVLSLFRVVFTLPIVGNLSIKSSYCDNLEVFDD